MIRSTHAEHHRGGTRIPRTLFGLFVTIAESSSPVPTWLLDGARTALDLEGTTSLLTRCPRPLRAEACGDCGGSGADSTGKSCGTCNGLGEIYCRAGRQALRVPSHSVIRKEGR